jgi:hypothetical protein
MRCADPLPDDVRDALIKIRADGVHQIEPSRVIGKDAQRVDAHAGIRQVDHRQVVDIGQRALVFARLAGIEDVQTRAECRCGTCRARTTCVTAESTVSGSAAAAMTIEGLIRVYS